MSGSEPIDVEGRIEGPISLPGSRVNIRRDGVVVSTVQAAEVEVYGTLMARSWLASGSKSITADP
jgi:cytoskeletal protein CcmA (bactofilin family)